MNSNISSVFHLQENGLEKTNCMDYGTVLVCAGKYRRGRQKMKQMMRRLQQCTQLARNLYWQQQSIRQY